jgi:hypothetical protein
MGRLLAIPDDEGGPKQFEFAAAQLSQFHDSINQLARLVASVSGLPPHFLGLAGTTRRRRTRSGRRRSAW